VLSNALQWTTLSIEATWEGPVWVGG